jgi:pimeloyl-ACP methyl ester carboxylesterase
VRGAPWWSTVGVVAAAAIGAAGGYRTERALLRGRLVGPRTATEPLGSLDGDLHEVRGPDGLRVTVETYGPEDAPQLVLAHGWTNTGRVWHEQVAGLADRYRIVTYDQPGHGRTSPPRSGRYSMDLLGDTLRAVIEQVASPAPIVLGGHSLGGMTVLNFAARHGNVVADRLRGVALLSTTSSARAETALLELGIASAARFERLFRIAVPWLRDPRLHELGGRIYRASSDLSYVMTRFWAIGPSAPSEVVDLTEQLVLDSDPDIFVGMTEAILSVDEDEALACLTVPTRIIVGTCDRLTPVSLSRRMAARCSHAELTELSATGHMTPLEAPAVVNATLAELLTGTAAVEEEPTGSDPAGSDGDPAREDDRASGGGAAA